MNAVHNTLLEDYEQNVHKGDIPSAKQIRNYIIHILKAVDIHALYCRWNNVTIDEIKRLAAFPSLPHPFIHTALGCIYCLCLSLETTPTTLNLPPWQILRLKALSGMLDWWQKAKQRLNGLRSGDKSHYFIPEQIDFACLLLFKYNTLYLDNTTRMMGQAIFESYAKVSTIATSLTSWIYLCLYYSLNFSTKQSHDTFPPPAIHAYCIPHNPIFRNSKDIYIRCGMKIGKSWCLLRIVYQKTINEDKSHVNVTILQMISFPNNFTQHEQLVQPISPNNRWYEIGDLLSDNSWLAHLQLNRYTRSAFLHLVSQAALVRSLPVATFTNGATVRCPDAKLFMGQDILKYALVHSNTKGAELSVQGIGHVIVSWRMKVTHLREKVRDYISAYEEYKFRFIYRGSILPYSSENTTSVMALLPFTVIVSVPRHRKIRTNAIHVHETVVIASMFNNRVTDALLQNLGRENSVIVLSAIYQNDWREVNYFPIEDHLCRLTDDFVEQLQSYFIHYIAYLRYQMLQTSTSIIQCFKDNKILGWKRLQKVDLLENLPEARHTKKAEFPKKKLNLAYEHLRAVYAVADIVSDTLAIIRSPNLTKLLSILSSVKVHRDTKVSNVRLVLGEEFRLIHVVGELAHLSNGFIMGNETQYYKPSALSSASIHIQYIRDESCPPDLLLNVSNAYVWQVVPHDKSLSLLFNSQIRENLIIQRLPPQYRLDIERYVIHPRIEMTTTSIHYSFFNISISAKEVENAVEDQFWSKIIDWEHHMQCLDIYTHFIEPLYVLLCRSHPPSTSLDSVKFSNLMRDCDIQPTLISIGEVAYLYSSHCSSSLQQHREMSLQGFTKSLEWLALQIQSRKSFHTNRTISEQGKKGGFAHAQSDTLQQFLLYYMTEAPIVRKIWLSFLHDWRVKVKLEVMVDYATKYCSATRIQALCKSWNTFNKYKLVMINFRRRYTAARLLQNIFRMIKSKRVYKRARQSIIHCQTIMKAKHERRQLRIALNIRKKSMARKIELWMLDRLRVLRIWKQINAEYIARKNRILNLRSRMLATGVFFLDIRRFYIRLYKSESISTNISNVAFELHIYDPRTSNSQVMHITYSNIKMWGLFYDEILKLDDPITSYKECFNSRCYVRTKPSRESSSYDYLLMCIASHINLAGSRETFYLPEFISASWTKVQFYFNQKLLKTAWGKCLLHTAVNLSSCQLEAKANTNANWHRVKFLARDTGFVVIDFSFCNSMTNKWHLSTRFVQLVLSLDKSESFLGVCNYFEEILKQQKSVALSVHQVVKFFKNRNRLLSDVVQRLLVYLLEYGTVCPLETVARVTEERKLQELRDAELLKNVIFVQSRVRAKRKLLYLALNAYSKRFDKMSKTFVYIHRNSNTIYSFKPWSLGRFDVPTPQDEWIFIDSNDSGGGLYYNAYRDHYSKFNTVMAAQKVQKWFRKCRAVGLPGWGLKHVARAMIYHNSSIHQTAFGYKISGNLRLALKYYVFDHNYKAANTEFLKSRGLESNELWYLVAFGLFLIFTCRYPIKETFAHGMLMITKAKNAESNEYNKSIQELEEMWFYWALFLHPTDPKMQANYAVFLHFIHGDLCRANTLYRISIDADPDNDFLLQNYSRLLETVATKSEKQNS